LIHSVQGGSEKSKLLTQYNSLLFLSHPVLLAVNLLAMFQVSGFNCSRDVERVPKIPKVGHVTLSRPPLSYWSWEINNGEWRRRCGLCPESRCFILRSVV